MASTVSLKNSTLNTQANELSLPEGSLREAKNVIIDRDDTIQSRRGFKEYGGTFGTSSDRAKQLLAYKQRILAHYENSIRVDDGNGNFFNLSGSYSEVETGLRIKGIEANSNFYFTTSNGIKKIVATSSADLTAATVVESSGVAGGIDLEGIANFNSANPPFLYGDSAVAYRVVWGKKDANDNLLLGAPSQRLVVVNSLLSSLNLDFNKITSVLDTFGFGGSVFNDKDYFSTYIGRDQSVQGLLAAISNVVPSPTASNFNGLVQKMDVEIISTSVGPPAAGALTVNAGDGVRFQIGDKIRLAGLSPASGADHALNSVFLVTNITGDVLTIQGGAKTFVSGYSTTGSAVIYRIKYSDVSASSAGFTDRSVTGSASGRIKVVFQSADKISGYCIGDTVTVSGAAVALYNGSFTIDHIEYDIVNNKFELEYNVSTSTSTDTNVCNIQLSTKLASSMPELPVVSDVLATNQELTTINSFLEEIILLLGNEPEDPSNPVISASLKLYLDAISINSGATVNLKFGVPSGIDTSYFYQIYRSEVATISGSVLTLPDLTASDELRLAIEDFPTSNNITNGYVTVEDFTPAEFVDQNANLYTNPVSGDGIAQANTAPPLASDIARFNDIIFYANTKTNHTFDLTLLGVAGMLRQLDAGVKPTLTITSGTTSNTYTFRKGVAQVQSIVTSTAVADGDYFYLYSANQARNFLIFYKNTSTPVVLDGYITVVVPLFAYAYSAANIASITAAAISQYSSDFSVSVVSNTLTITQVTQGYVLAANTSGGPTDPGFTINAPSTLGVGERITGSENTVKLEDSDSSAVSIDQTARSLCRIINANPSEIVNAYYISSGNLSPGIMQFRRRTLLDTPFYVTTNSSDAGLSFNPILSPYKQIAGVNAAINQVSVIAHGLQPGDKILVSGNLSTPSMDGLRTVVSVSNVDNFIIDIDVTVAGTVFGAITKYTDAEKSKNLGAINRVYYSKFQQPEAVPLANYFDVGPKDSAIKRIIALRDSLFIFKEEAVYRVGNTTPFFPALFDSSVQIIGPDTVCVLNNQIYVFADSGLMLISETGTSLTSRNIYFDLTKAATFQNNFTASFGVSYEPDSSYLVFICSNSEATIADICYRYNTITQSWTTFDRTQTCGIMSSNKLYFGAGKKNTLHIERKDFTRKDFADEEIAIDIQGPSISQNKIFFPSISNFAVGDSVIQSQTVTNYEFESLNTKLASDPGMPIGFIPVEVITGSNLNLKLLELVQQLDSLFTTTKTITAIGVGVNAPITISGSHSFLAGDKIKITGSNSTPGIDGIATVVSVTGSNSFTINKTTTVAGSAGTISFNFIASEVGAISGSDSFALLQTHYNTLINLLNTSGLLGYRNYSLSQGIKEFEMKVSAVNKNEFSIGFIAVPQLIEGTALLYKAIQTSVVYAPTLMGEPISIKHVREAQLFTENRNFTKITSKFASDLSPGFETIEFNGNGTGTFGSNQFGEMYFGGGTNSSPLRTFIPRNKQRCRFIRVGFEHSSALEEWKVYGMSLTFEPTSSTRAYR